MSLHRALIELHSQAWMEDANSQILEAASNPENVVQRIRCLMDRVFEGVLKGRVDLLSSIDECSEHAEFNFQYLQFEHGSTQTVEPRKSTKSILNFCKFLQVIDIVLDGLQTGRYRSKREVYYAHQDVFEKQEHVNQVVKHLSYLLRVPRRSLCIVSSSKGLCAGALMLRNEEVELDVRYLSTQGKGLPITEFMDEWQEVVVYGRFILVVEKETVYFRLLQEANPSFLELCVLVTGKGYPCHSTQSFLKLVSTSNPDVPIYYLGDLDPHGFDILCLYTFGNQASMYERNNVPWIQWLGLAVEAGITKGYPLTEKERTLITNMKQRSYFNPPEQISAGVHVQAQIWMMWLATMYRLLEIDQKYEVETLVPEKWTLTDYCMSLIEKYEDLF